MGLRDLTLRSSYETEESRTHLLDTFYVPVLEQATAYYRIAGYFSSAALTVAARGIEGLIHNGGRMYLLISPTLSRSDYDAIQTYGGLREDNALFAIRISGNANDSVRALAWLLAQDRLKIKIVVGRRSPESLFHQKVGIITDGRGDQISFRGPSMRRHRAGQKISKSSRFSVMGTGAAGIRQRRPAEVHGVLENRRPAIAEAYDIPDAIREKLLRVRPDDVMELSIMQRYGTHTGQDKPNTLSLFPHQEEAVQQWKNNRGALLVEMATGTGKTRTAIGCMVETLKKEPQFLTIVATPQNTLSRQWQGDLKSCISGLTGSQSSMGAILIGGGI